MTRQAIQFPVLGFLAIALILAMPGIASATDAAPRVIARGYPSDPLFAVDGNDAVAIWIDKSPTGQSAKVLFSRDGGQTFSAPETILSDSDSIPTSLVLAGGHAHVCWIQSTSNGEPAGVYYGSLDLARHVVSIPQRLSGKDRDSRLCRLYAAGSRVLAVWKDITQPGEPALHFAYSSDEGASISEEPNLTLPFQGSELPDVDLAHDGGKAFVVWPSDQPDTQGNWVGLIDLAKMQMIKGLYSHVQSFDLVAMDGDHVVIMGEGKAHVSHDGGLSFTAPVDLLSSGTPSLNAETLYAGSGLVAAAFATAPYRDIFLITSNDNGQTFSSPVKMSVDLGEDSGSYAPQFIQAGKAFAVTWSELLANGDEAVAFRVSSDGGRSFGDARRTTIVTQREGTFGGVRAAASSNEFLFLWAQPSPGGNREGAVWLWKAKP